MRVIIAGSRSITRISFVAFAMEEWRLQHDVSEVLSGAATGVDSLGEIWAKDNRIPVSRFPAEWRVNGVLDRRAGFKRNRRMAKHADGCVAVWDGFSPGTKDMIERSCRAGLPTLVYDVLTGAVTWRGK